MHTRQWGLDWLLPDSVSDSPIPEEWVKAVHAQASLVHHQPHHSLHSPTPEGTGEEDKDEEDKGSAEYNAVPAIVEKRNTRVSWSPHPPPLQSSPNHISCDWCRDRSPSSVTSRPSTRCSLCLSTCATITRGRPSKWLLR